jgi:glucokinase
MILSIDFGGTRTRVGWFSESLELLKREEMLSQASDPADTVIARIIDLARLVAPPDGSPAAIGICAPGPQAYKGIILNAATLPGWDNIPLARLVSEAFAGALTFMENDANLAAVAEYAFGAARGADPAIYLTISTGIGGGAIIHGELFTGWRGLALEPGHIKFPAPDGRILSLEDFASGTGIGRNARERLASTSTPSVLRGCSVVDGKAVGEAAMRGDAFALEIIREAGHWLGLGLVVIIHLFNPQVIVLGGSVTQLGELILEPARRVLTERLLDPAFNPPDLIRPAALGDDVCLIGAARYARDRLHRQNRL